MKSNHIELVSTCRNYVQGKCEYDMACWFVHGPTDRMNTNEGNEKLIGEDRILLKRLVEMVEKLTKRVFPLHFCHIYVRKWPLQRKHFPMVLRAHLYIFGISGSRRTGKTCMQIQNPTFLFFAPPLIYILTP